MSPSLLERLFVPRLKRQMPAVEPGLFHFMQTEAEQPNRFHLRVDAGGTGLLIANANAAAYLTPSGTMIAKLILEGEENESIIAQLEKNFEGGSQQEQMADIERVRRLLIDLSDPGDLYPIFNLEDPALLPHAAPLLPPLEADIPYAKAATIKSILGRLWQAGIPHVVIRVDEQYEPAELVDIVAHAEALGLICGVSGRASDIEKGSLLDDLAMAGVDHVTVFYASADPQLHDDLFGQGDHGAAERLFARTQALQIADVAQVPLVAGTLQALESTLERLPELNVPNVAFYAIATLGEESEGPLPAPALPQLAAEVEDTTSMSQVRFLWEPPMEYDAQIGLAAQIRKGPRCSGDMAVRIEVDGSVIPARGPYSVAGNILHEDWQAIWQSDAFLRYRRRIESPTRCELCPGLAICAADCPREPIGWSHGDSRSPTPQR